MYKDILIIVVLAIALGCFAVIAGIHLCPYITM